jgi:hypothetical protein
LKALSSKISMSIVRIFTEEPPYQLADAAGGRESEDKAGNQKVGHVACRYYVYGPVSVRLRSTGGLSVVLPQGFFVPRQTVSVYSIASLLQVYRSVSGTSTCTVNYKRHQFSLSINSALFFLSTFIVATMAPQAEKRKNIGGPRFADPKKPRWLTQAEKEQAAKRKEQAPSNFISSKEIIHCPYHGVSLDGEAMRCPKCRKGFLERRVVKVPEIPFRVVVDCRHCEEFWRRKLFNWVQFPFHSNVVWTAEPHVDYWVWNQVFRDNLDCESYRTPAVETNIKILETTYAVERFCNFGSVHAQKGYLSAKVVNNDAKDGGKLLMVAPPVEIAHLQSQARGAYIMITFGWIKLNKHGVINKAESMPVPAEGWPHVLARCRDLAARISEFGGNGGMNINTTMVKDLERKLLAEYSDMAAFVEDCKKREAQRAYYLMPRP